MPNALLRHDRLIVLFCLIAVILLAWAYLLLGAGIDMEQMEMDGGKVMLMAPPWSPRYATLIFVMWAIMMMAMMLPSTAPAILLADALMRPRGGDGVFGSIGLFILGYVIVWLGFSLIATVVQYGLDQAGLLSETMSSGTASMSGVVLIAAGIYEWTPLKQACLVQCRSPFEHLIKYWRRGNLGPMLAGLHHGSFCLGCCWMLMALLFVGGLMNVVWIGGIAALVLVEKVFPFGPRASRLTGVALIAWGAAVLFRGIIV